MLARNDGSRHTTVEGTILNDGNESELSDEGRDAVRGGKIMRDNMGVVLLLLSGQKRCIEVWAMG